MIEIGDTVTSLVHDGPGMISAMTSTGLWYVEGPGWKCVHVEDDLTKVEAPARHLYASATLAILDGVLEDLALMGDAVEASSPADFAALRDHVREHLA